MSRAFRKHNATGYEDALEREAEGLESLRVGLHQAGVAEVHVPEVYSVSNRTMDMTTIQASPATTAEWEQLGAGLARLHRIEAAQYGWERDNYIGLSPQPNDPCTDWGEFFVTCRLEYQVSRIKDSSLRARFNEILSRSRRSLAAWLSKHCAHPSLVHGDLWSGNVLFDRTGPWLIDPAVYHGDREVDLAMTEMFGGFGAAFYDAYDQIYPRTAQYSHKREVYNLYHYLNHYNLFGPAYLAGCERGFRTIVQIVAEG